MFQIGDRSDAPGSAEGYELGSRRQEQSHVPAPSEPPKRRDDAEADRSIRARFQDAGEELHGEVSHVALHGGETSYRRRGEAEDEIGVVSTTAEQEGLAQESHEVPRATG